VYDFLVFADEDENLRMPVAVQGVSECQGLIVCQPSDRVNNEHTGYMEVNNEHTSYMEEEEGATGLHDGFLSINRWAELADWSECIFLKCWFEVIIS